MAGYVIITPAHNEQQFIENTILSVINQTICPALWVVVNDNSTDRTAEIVSRYCLKHDFIKLVNVEREKGRNFGYKVFAFNRGRAETLTTSYDFIGNLDADISLEKDYFENLLRKFDLDAELGIGGGMVNSLIDGKYVSQNVALDSVAGAVQLFRRACFDEIGGYLALSEGGTDSAAEITARMKGWRVQTFPELRVLEHRRTGSATARPLASRIQEGRRMHSLGYGPFFFFARCVYRSFEKPRILGGAAALCGYLTRKLRGDPMALPPDVVRYLRLEQNEKLKRRLWPRINL